MDNYLESLVRKGEAVQPVEEEPVNEEAVADEPITEATPEEPVKEEPEVEAKLVAEEKVEAAVQDIAKKEAESAKEVPEVELAKKAEPVIGYEKDRMTSAENIKMFNSADPKGVFKIFTGNIIYKDKINGMYLVEYVKPGLGLVKGFVTDLQ